ncbi:unnamed protein product [Leuciscus chuanchicus]
MSASDSDLGLLNELQSTQTRVCNRESVRGLAGRSRWQVVISACPANAAGCDGGNLNRPRRPSASQHSSRIRASVAAIVTGAHLAPTAGLVLAKGNTGIQNVNSSASVNKSLQLNSGLNRRGWRGPYTSLRRGERELLIILTQDNTAHASNMHLC